MTQPLVSILLATYCTNEQHLRQCIDSILRQTYPHFELLILDDCPTDMRVEKIVKSYADKRIKYRRNPKNLGISATRTELMNWGEGKYFAVMDHDDIMLPKRLEKQVALMEQHSDIGVCGTAYKRFGVFNKQGIVRHAQMSDDIAAGLFFKCTIHHPSCMIRADIIRKNHIIYNTDYISVNDRCLYLDIMAYARLYNLPDVLMLYRMHSGQVSCQESTTILNEQQQLRDIMLKKLGAELTEEQHIIFNDYVMRGRCKIKNHTILQQIEQVLVLLDKANQKSGYFSVQAFSQLCGKYFIKRCCNAVFYGRISSQTLLKQTVLQIARRSILLNIFNQLAKDK